MRGDTTASLRSLRRPAGVAGILAAGAGVTAAVAVYLPWYVVISRVTLLGRPGQGEVATLPGWESHPWAAIVPLLGIIAAVVALLAAFDRPPPRARDLLLGCGAGLAVLGAIGGRFFPPVSRFDLAGSRVRELLDVSQDLPMGVSVDLAVRPGVGLWLTVAAAAVLVIVASTNRELS